MSYYNKIKFDNYTLEFLDVVKRLRDEEINEMIAQEIARRDENE